MVGAPRTARLDHLLAALEEHFGQDRDEAQCFVWLDVLCTDLALLRGEPTELPPGSESSVRSSTGESMGDPAELAVERERRFFLKKGLGVMMGNFEERLFFFESLLAPKALERSWCVWEIYCASRSKNPLTILHGEASRRELLDLVLDADEDAEENPEGLGGLLARLADPMSAGHACSNPADGEILDRLISLLADDVKGVLSKEWALTATSVCEADYPKDARVLMRCGRLLAAAGVTDLAVSYFDRSCTLGQPKTLHQVHAMISVYRTERRFDAALELAERCFDIASANQGTEQCVEAARELALLAEVCHQAGEELRVQQALQRVLDTCDAIQPETDASLELREVALPGLAASFARSDKPLMAASMERDFARFLLDTNRVEEARPIARKALATFEERAPNEVESVVLLQEILADVVPGMQRWMDAATHDEVRSICRAVLAEPGDTKERLQAALPDAWLAARGVSWEAAVSVFQREYREEVMRTSLMHRKRAAQYLADVRGGERVLAVAERVRFSPYLLARMVVEHAENETRSRGAAGEKNVGRVLSRKELGAMMKDPSRISDVALREQVQECIDADPGNSPFFDRLRDTIGDEFEYLLEEKLRAHGILFQSETALRDMGMAKTPDVKLEVPIGILPDTPEAQGRAVFWIDSKAMFGDQNTHRDNLAQLQGYVNRFGPGMVIYWFGFVDDLHDDPDIFVVSDFPPQQKQIVLSSSGTHPGRLEHRS
ncbi:CDAN1-interacting nuclease 1 [Durusdinium trenchii]|uniref:CDAN1-interacting nuclease 1 n=1 Tax=Durusdinium trenchii TaxID=1381693 RepID=A0ABP0RHA6_9DINO